LPARRFTHVGKQLIPAGAFGDDAFGQALSAVTTVSLLNHFKDGVYGQPQGFWSKIPNWA
jgi:hypothetical protein